MLLVSVSISILTALGEYCDVILMYDIDQCVLDNLVYSLTCFRAASTPGEYCHHYFSEEKNLAIIIKIKMKSNIFQYNLIKQTKILTITGKYLDILLLQDLAKITDAVLLGMNYFLHSDQHSDKCKAALDKLDFLTTNIIFLSRMDISSEIPFLIALLR